MKILLLGSTGMAGQALQKEAVLRNWTVVGVARHGADHCGDLTDDSFLENIFEQEQPEAVCNAAALVSLDDCQNNPDMGWRINGRMVSVATELCRVRQIPLLHISTDHYFTGDGPARHNEKAPVVLINDYARSKYAGESCALTYPGSLVLRTNITGLRGWPDRPTFVEWALGALEAEQPLTLFNDFYTSTMDTGSFARTAFDLSEKGATGLFNVGCREACSKASFINLLAETMGARLIDPKTDSVHSLLNPRADSLGLDVSRAEAFLERSLPDLNEVVRALIKEYSS